MNVYLIQCLCALPHVYQYIFLQLALQQQRFFYHMNTQVYSIHPPLPIGCVGGVDAHVHRPAIHGQTQCT